MIPKFVRVAAIDNEQEHLEKIYSALVRAGYWVMPFLYDLGSVSPEPPSPYNGVRLIFTDIHLNDGGMNNMAQQALAIVSALKKIVCDGPYVVIFWTKFPTDAEEVFNNIKVRAKELELVPPVGYGCIDKNLVLTSDNSNLVELKTQIDEAIKNSGALLLSVSWEERVSQAAVLTTHRLFELARSNENEDALTIWHKLLSFLSAQSVGEAQVQRAPIAAMDSALLPILEDRLTAAASHAVDSLGELLLTEDGNMPPSISCPSLNSHYLVSTLVADGGYLPSSRGVVSLIQRNEWDASQNDVWGCSCNDAIRKEFLLTTNQSLSDDKIDEIQPCLVTLTPECDDVQGKVVSYRYLFAVLVPFSDSNRSWYFSKSKKQYSNLSIFDAGVLSLDIGSGKSDYCLLISCNRFFARPTSELMNVTPKLRLRRATLEELSHHYATHSRRPGVMRFSLY